MIDWCIVIDKRVNKKRKVRKRGGTSSSSGCHSVSTNQFCDFEVTAKECGWIQHERGLKSPNSSLNRSTPFVAIRFFNKIIKMFDYQKKYIEFTIVTLPLSKVFRLALHTDHCHDWFIDRCDRKILRDSFEWRSRIIINIKDRSCIGRIVD